jgi:hypothetical protein
MPMYALDGGSGKHMLLRLMGLEKTYLQYRSPTDL